MDLGHVQSGQFVGYLFPMGPYFAGADALGRAGVDRRARSGWRRCSGSPAGAWCCCWMRSTSAAAARVHLDRRRPLPRQPLRGRAGQPRDGLAAGLRGPAVDPARRPSRAARAARLAAGPRRSRSPSRPSSGGTNAATVFWIVARARRAPRSTRSSCSAARASDALAFAWRAAARRGAGLGLVDRPRADRRASRARTSSPSPSSRARSGRRAACRSRCGSWGTGCRTSRPGSASSRSRPRRRCRPYLTNEVVIAATFAVPLLAFGGLLLTRRWRYAPFFGLLAVGALLVMAAGYPAGKPAAGTLEAIYYNFAGQPVPAHHLQGGAARSRSPWPASPGRRRASCWRWRPGSRPAPGLAPVADCGGARRARWCCSPTRSSAAG